MVIQQYQDPSVNRRLRFGFWYQEHKAQLAKIGIGILIAFNALFWIYTFYGVGRLVLDSQAPDVHRGLVQQYSDVDAIHSANAPLPLSILDIAILPSASESGTIATQTEFADFVAKVANPNQNWAMDITYTFSYEGGTSKSAQWIVLPESETYLAVIGAPVVGLPREASLETVITWKRIKDNTQIARPQQALTDFTIENPVISVFGNTTDMSITLTNNGQYSIIDASFLVLAERFDGQIQALWKNDSPIIQTGESIVLQRRFLRALASSLQLQVVTNFNFFDEQSYQLPERAPTPF